MSVQLLRRADLQSKLAIGRTKFFEWQASGKLPQPKLLNGLPVWVESDVDRWISESLTPANEPAQ